jgi:hypothetical protein
MGKTPFTVILGTRDEKDKGCKQGLSFVKEHLLATKAGHHSHLLRE